MDTLRVYLRDLTSGEWITYSTDAWLEQYPARVRDALDVHAGTFGGSFAITGTPERGRLSVFDTNSERLLDFDWMTMTVDEAARSQHQHRPATDA